MLLLLHGRLHEAEAAILQRVRTPGAAGRRADFEPLVGAQLTQLRIFQGRAGEVLPLIKPLPDRMGRGWLAVIAYAGAEAGLPDEARAALDGLAADDFADVFESVHWPILLSAAAQACVLLHATEHAERRYALLRPIAGAHLVPRPLVVSYGAADRTLGGLATLLGRWEEASAHLDLALALHRRVRARPWELWTLVDRAALWLRRGAPGDREAARALIADTRRRSAALGLRGVGARLEALAGSIAEG
mgnify:FL=1